MPDCRKVCYRNRKAAKKALKSWNRKNPDKPLGYPYWCPRCMNFHLTSISKKKRKYFNKNRKKK